MAERFEIIPSERRAGFWELVDRDRARFARFVSQDAALSASMRAQPIREALIWRDLDTGRVIESGASEDGFDA